MKKFLAVLAAFAVMAIGSQALADPPQGKALRLVGTVKRGSQIEGASASATSGTITTGGSKVRMIVVSAGGTATNVGLANVDAIASATAADYVIDVSAAANSTTVLDLTDCPLDFSAGISVGGDSNATGVSVYEYQNE